MIRASKVLRTVILCGLALTTLALAETSKMHTLVTYPSAFAVSQRVSELPVHMLLLPSLEMTDPWPSPLVKRATRGPSREFDPALQMEVLPEVGVQQGVNFDGIVFNGWIPSDSNLAVGPTEIGAIVNTYLTVYSKMGTLF